MINTIIDNNYINYLSYIFYASTKNNEVKKYEYLTKANNSLDLVKLLLDVSFDIKCIKEKTLFKNHFDTTGPVWNERSRW